MTKPATEERVAHTPRQGWTKQDYDHSAAISTVADHIVKRVAENAVRLAIVRHDLANDAETSADEIVKDVLAVVTGEDASCDPDDDESVEILWAEKELRETLKEYPPTDNLRTALVDALRAILEFDSMSVREANKRGVDSLNAEKKKLRDQSRAALSLATEQK